MRSGLTALHTWKYNTAQGFGIHHALNPDTYRGPYGPEVPDVGKKYADDVKDLILTGTAGLVSFSFLFLSFLFLNPFLFYLFFLI